MRSDRQAATQVRWKVAPRAPVQGSTERCGWPATSKGGSSMSEIEWWVGFDWASEKHRACLIDAGGRVVGERDVLHGGDGLAEFCAWLLDKTGAPPACIAVAIETPHGPVVEGLLERGFQVHAINPKQLDRFRDRFSPS